jgi:hypothetical protein
MMILKWPQSEEGMIPQTLTKQVQNMLKLLIPKMKIH